MKTAKKRKVLVSIKKKENKVKNKDFETLPKYESDVHIKERGKRAEKAFYNIVISMSVLKILWLEKYFDYLVYLIKYGRVSRKSVN